MASKKHFFKRRPVATAAAVVTQLVAATGAYAGIGFVDGSDPQGNPVRYQTFFSSSPSGLHRQVPLPWEIASPWSDKNGAAHPALFPDRFNPAGYQGSGKAFRKFVDPLAPLGLLPSQKANTLTDQALTSPQKTPKYIPLATAEKWVNPNGVLTGDDYYELACIEYTERVHSDIRKPTTFRGYIQIETNAMKAARLANPATAVSKGIPLFYPIQSWPNTQTAANLAPGATMPGADWRGQDDWRDLSRPIMIQDTDARGALLFDVSGKPVMKQAMAVDESHYLGPAVLSVRNVATRYKFYNLLPAGRAQLQLDAAGNPVRDAHGNLVVLKRNGDLPIPVDLSIVGAGVGIDGITMYTQNRIAVHLHGGDTPWVSDGTAHQWFAPAGEHDATVPGTLASNLGGDPALLNHFLYGASYARVPDMADPGPGAMTFYYPNGQAARLMWYHDHALALTRLNAYMGEAAAYWLTDTTELDLMGPTPGVNPAGRGVVPGLLDTIPLVLQEKSFVPNDIALQDLHWNTTAWGEPGDLWYAHVYETVQEPSLQDGWSPVGRWHYGPWFWPVFPALYALPSGAYGDETLTPENWGDTPIINGVIYPFVEVEPKPYRLRMLNGSNDRMFSFNLFDAGPPRVLTAAEEADKVLTFPDDLMLPRVLTTTVNRDIAGDLPATWPAWAVSNPAVLNPLGQATVDVTINAGWVADPTVVGKYHPTEVKMVPAVVPAAPCAAGVKRPGGTDILTVAAARAASPTGYPTVTCTPVDWPSDGRNGGVPDPATVGPTLYQFMNEGGLLAKLAPTENLPTNPLYDRGRAAVLNVNTSGIFLANAERADVLVDFSQYAGRTLIAYNDLFAPVPAGDPRNDYFTGVGDQSPQGGAEDTLPAIGPNTRTLMQFRVKPTLANGAVPTVADAFENPAKTTLPNLANLKVEIPKAFAATQEPPVVAQAAYNDAFHPNNNCPAIVKPNTTGCWDDVRSYASIYLSSLKQPYFDFIPGNPGLFDAIIVTNGGTGYVTAPQVVFTGGGATTPAIANATLKIGQINVLNPGSGYSVAPGVQIAATVAGGGAVAEATLLVQSAIISNGGSGYTTAPAVIFGLPQTATGVRATGTAVLTNGVVTGITITNPGSGYTAMPQVTIGAPPAGGVQATASASGGVSAFRLIPIDPSNPGSAGGGGYTDMTKVMITLTLPDLPGGVLPTLQPVGSVMDVTLATDTKSYVTLPTVTLVGGGGAGAVAQILGTTPITDVNGTVVTPPTNGTTLARYMIKGKAVQELFDPTFGRLNATFATELPFTSALTQTTIPLAFVDQPTEFINDFETQIWKLTHNGVDTHPVHFHLMNVQIINRVGWDGFITPPDPKEIGWKETVVINPLEDIIVALKPKRTAVGGGFGFPQSVRLMDPTQPEGSPFGFTQISVTSGLPTQVVNAVMNFGWEYTWHCHILGHEENDFMRALVFNIHEAPPVAPSGLKINTATGVMPTFVPGQGYAGVPLAWTDNSATEYQQILQRADGATSTTFTTIATLPANQTSYIDTKVDGPLTYRYQITAVGAAGQAVSPIFNVTTPSIPPAPPSGLVASQVGAGVQLSWVDNSTTETNFVIQQSVNGGAFTPVATMNSATKVAVGGVISYTIPAATAGSVVYRVASNNLAGNANYNSAFATSAPVNVNGAPNPPTSVTGVAISETQAQLTWTDASNNEGTFVIQAKDLTANAATFTTVGTVQGLPNSGSLASFVAPVLNGHSYMFQVAAVGLGAAPATSAYTASAIVPVKFLPAAPTNVIATIVSPTLITVKWTDAANNETNYTVEASADGGATWLAAGTVAAATGTGTQLSANFTTPLIGTAYLFRVNAVNGAGMTQTQTTPVLFAPSLTGLTAVSNAPNTATLAWVDGGPLETGYKIERQIGAGPWTVLGTTAANIKTYTAIGLTANTVYNFRITPVRVAGAQIQAGSPVMATVTTPALPAAPTGVMVTATSPTAVSVSWVDSSTNETAFQVQRQSGAVWTTVATVTTAAGASATTGTLGSAPVTAGLVSKATYNFRVVPMVGTLPGIPSATATVTMP